MKIGIIAALPREIGGLVRGVSANRELLAKGIHLYALPSATVVCAGMGGTRVTLAVEAAMRAGDIASLVSVGLAGGCDPALAVGSVVEAKTVVDALSGERHATGYQGTGVTLVTTHAIASVSEKERLFAAYGAAVVDMEAAAVGRLAQMHGVSFRAIKAVSDAHDFELSSLSRFASPHGHFRTGAFALHTALRPAGWRKAMQLGSGSNRALKGLTAALQELISESGEKR